MAIRVYSPHKKQQALAMYMSGSKGLADICQELGVPGGTLRGWHFRGAWARTRRNLEEELRAEWLQEARSVLEGHGLRIIHESFEASDRLRERIDEMVETRKLDPRELLDLSRALYKVMDVIEVFFKRTDTKPRDTRVPLVPSEPFTVRFIGVLGPEGPQGPS